MNLIKKLTSIKLSKKASIILSSIFLLFALVTFFFVAIAFYGDKHSIADVFKVMFSSKLLHPGIDQSTKDISRSIWIIFAMLMGGMGLAVTGVISQSLTKNPLADASTLGTINASIFFIIISFSAGIIAFWAQYIFAIIGGLVAAGLLLMIILFTKRGKLTNVKFLLAGLSLSIAFKTASFFFWRGDRGIGGAYSSYILGGSEKIYGSSTLMTDQWTTLLVSVILILVGMIIILFNSKGMSVIELGDQKAKGLGISVTRVRVLNIIALVLIVPASVLIVGNIAFIGLVATHVVRISFKTRDYKKLVPLVALVGMAMAMFGLVMNIMIPRLNSSIWITIIGAPVLIYLGWRRL